MKIPSVTTNDKNTIAKKIDDVLIVVIRTKDSVIIDDVTIAVVGTKDGVIMAAVMIRDAIMADMIATIETMGDMTDPDQRTAGVKTAAMMADTRRAAEATLDKEDKMKRDATTVDETTMVTRTRATDKKMDGWFSSQVYHISNASEDLLPHSMPRIETCCIDCTLLPPIIERCPVKLICGRMLS